MGHIQKYEKLTDNPFLNLYHLSFQKKDGSAGNYYFCTRNDETHLKINTHALNPEGICVYAVTKENEPRLVVIREYRFPIDETIYSLPCGLIDKGETPGQAATRELLEETGYHFTEYTGGASFARRPFFLAPGFSDEPGSCVFGQVGPTPEKQHLENTEWISVELADKKEVRRILNEEKTSVRAAFLMMNFLKSNGKEPFRFLDI